MRTMPVVMTNPPRRNAVASPNFVLCVSCNFMTRGMGRARIVTLTTCSMMLIATGNEVSLEITLGTTEHTPECQVSDIEDCPSATSKIIIDWMTGIAYFDDASNNTPCSDDANQHQ